VGLGILDVCCYRCLDCVDNVDGLDTCFGYSLWLLFCSGFGCYLVRSG